MELRLPLEMSPGREAACRAVFGTWGFFPNDAQKNCPFVWTSFSGWSSETCPGIGFLSRGDREIGVLRNVEPPTRPRLDCLRETGLILRCDRKVGNPFQTKQGSRPSCPDQEGRKGSEATASALHSSNRSAPPAMAARADAKESTQISNSIFLSPSVFLYYSRRVGDVNLRFLPDIPRPDGQPQRHHLLR